MSITPKCFKFWSFVIQIVVKVIMKCLNLQIHENCMIGLKVTALLMTKMRFYTYNFFKVLLVPFTRVKSIGAAILPISKRLSVSRMRDILKNMVLSFILQKYYLEFGGKLTLDHIMQPHIFNLYYRYMFLLNDEISVSFRCNKLYIFSNTKYWACFWFHNVVKYW